MSDSEYKYDRTAELAKAGFKVTVTAVPLPVQVELLTVRVKELEAIIDRINKTPRK